MVNMVTCLRGNQRRTQKSTLFNEFGKHIESLLARCGVALTHQRHDSALKK
jgi:hypothetical protein